MAKGLIESMDDLFEYEKRYANELKENSIEILREVKVTKEELEDIAECISIIYESDKRPLQLSFPITVSLFLVWCTVYEYKDGDMWSNIFEKLKIPSSTNGMQFFGDIFLSVLNEHELMQVKEGEGKKYLSPILMHGYISNHYAYDLFDYLNKIYSIVLEEDTSEEAIDDVWNDIFSENTELDNIKKDKRLLEENRQKTLDEIRKYDNIDDEIKSINYEYVEGLETEVNDLEELINSNAEKIKNIDKKLNKNSSINEKIIDIDTSFSRLCTKFSDVNNEDLVYSYNLVYEVKTVLENKINILVIKKDQIIKENGGLKNKLAIKRENLISIKTKISALGQGILDDGWAKIEEYTKLKEELENIKLQIKKKQKYLDITELEKNATIKQILTASLHNLRLSHPEYFKDFMTRTIQMLGEYFSGEEIDDTHPLYDVFMEWTNRKLEEPQHMEVSKPGLKSIEIKDVTKGKRLVLQSMKKPYIRLDTDKLNINIIIPEQSFTFRQGIDSEPHYAFMDKDGNVFDLDIDYIYLDQELYIKEMIIPIDFQLFEYLSFNWYNLKELHDISLDEFMIFDESGTLLKQNKVKNGYYYIVCEKSWSLNEGLIVNEHNLLLDSYKIYEIYMNETKTKLYNKDKNKSHKIIATNYSICYLDNYNPIEGIYSNKIPVVTGLIPELIINYIDIDPKLIHLNIFVNDNLIYHKEVEYLIEKNKINRENSVIRVNIYKLLRFKNITACKFKIILGYLNEEPILKEEFYFLPRTQFKYTSEGLMVIIQKGMRLTSNNSKQKGTKYLIPLKNKEGEAFSIYYDRNGWVKIWVEVPIVTAKIFDKDGKENPNEHILYGSKREKVKDLFIQWETNSKRVKSILLFDNNHYLETRLYMKGGKARTSIEPYFDIFKEKDGGQLFYRAEDENTLIKEKIILNLYDKWEVSNIKVHQKEEIDEYILGIDYEQNFLFNEPKYLEILNDDRIIIKKTIEDQIYIYIKKKDLTSNKIKINFLYDDEYEDVFGRKKNTIVAGTTDIKFKSRINEIDTILNNGILVTGFKYDGEIYSIKNPLDLAMVKKTNSKNFTGEEMYMSNILSNGVTQNVYFYIDTENKILPFLIDKDNDGAQYDPKDGRVFWENCKDKDVMAPLENIVYIVKEER